MLIPTATSKRLADVPHTREAVDAAIAADDELQRIERDRQPLPAELCDCPSPWLERWPVVGLHCCRCGHDRQVVA